MFAVSNTLCCARSEPSQCFMRVCHKYSCLKKNTSACQNLTRMDVWL